MLGIGAAIPVQRPQPRTLPTSAGSRRIDAPPVGGELPRRRARPPPPCGGWQVERQVPDRRRHSGESCEAARAGHRLSPRPRECGSRRPGTGPASAVPPRSVHSWRLRAYTSGYLLILLSRRIRCLSGTAPAQKPVPRAEAEPSGVRRSPRSVVLLDPLPQVVHGLGSEHGPFLDPVLVPVEGPDVVLPLEREGGQ